MTPPTKHTPGRWDGFPSNRVSVDGAPVATIEITSPSSPHWIAHVKLQGARGGTAEGLANAQILIAAQDTYKALRKCVTLLGRLLREPTVSAGEVAQAQHEGQEAIDRAEGRVRKLDNIA